jgi:hypothetical protein
MPNHFRLVLETHRSNLVAGMKWVLGAYTSRFNRRHKFFGPLRLRRETTMTLKWMAKQLAMGAWANVARRLDEAKP